MPTDPKSHRAAPVAHVAHPVSAASNGRLRFAVIGGGAVGLYMAARLGLSGQDVILAVRPGRPLAAVAVDEEGEHALAPEVAVRSVSEPPAPDEAPDVLIAALKAHQLSDALPDLLPWIGPRTQLLLPQNGIPWWYFQGEAGPHNGRAVQAADPGGNLAAALPVARVIGCVVHKSMERLAGHQVRAVRAAGDRFVLGRPGGFAGGVPDPELLAVAEAFSAAGLPPEVTDRLRDAVWDKLLGNAVLNPLSALTRADMASLCGYPPTQALILAAMTEVRNVARAYGAGHGPGADPAARLARSATVGARGVVRTSMLQDLLAGRPLEVAPLVGAVVELAGLAGVPVPHLETLNAAAGLLSLRLQAEREAQD